MERIYITGYDLYYAFQSGFAAVKKQHQQLNKINVFPVPDGDTGTNLVSTIGFIIEEANPSDSFKETMNSMADAALNGARGNSGIIFAQFINGINHEIKTNEKVTLDHLIESMHLAVPYAYSAIMEPVEGTMITVIREWSEAMNELKNTAANLEELAIRSLEAAKRSLANTPNLLEILRISSVVDSGAFGFVTFLEGIAHFVANKGKSAIPQLKEKISAEVEESHVHLMEDIQYQYCTEALITNVKGDMEDLKKSLMSLGDSLIIAGTPEKFRIHIHTNTPAVFFRMLRDHCDILQQKVEDMKQQYKIVHERRHNIAIVTDSIADLHPSLIEKHQIHVLPLNLMIEGSPYLDKLTITPDDFYSLIDQIKTYPTSSLPSQKRVEELFALLTSQYDAVIAIIVSKEMSGTYQCVEKAAQKFIENGKRIQVINSKLNSGAQGLLVLEAAKQLDLGCDLDQVLTHIEKQIKKAKIYVSVKNLKYMVRGGRISPLKGIVGHVLNLKPIVSIDEFGNGTAFGKAFTISANINKIIEIVNEANRESRITSYCVVHAQSEKQAKEIAKRLTADLGIELEYITEISTIVGLNAGVGATAVSFIQA